MDCCHQGSVEASLPSSGRTLGGPKTPCFGCGVGATKDSLVLVACTTSPRSLSLNSLQGSQFIFGLSWLLILAFVGRGVEWVSTQVCLADTPGGETGSRRPAAP